MMLHLVQYIMIQLHVAHGLQWKRFCGNLKETVMRYLQKSGVILGIVGTLLSLDGCIFAAREAIGTVRGGHSSTSVTKPIADLSAYHNVLIGPFQNSVGSDVTPQDL